MDDLIEFLGISMSRRGKNYQQGAKAGCPAEAQVDRVFPLNKVAGIVIWYSVIHTDNSPSILTETDMRNTPPA